MGRLVTSIQPASGLPGALASAVCFLSHQTQPKPHIASYRIISHHIASYRIISHHTYFACLICMFPIQSVATFTNYKLSRFTSMVHQVASRSPTRLRLVSSCGSSQMWIRMDQALPSQMWTASVQGICVRIIIILYPAHSE